MGVKTFTHCSASHSQEMLSRLNVLRGEGQLCDVTIRVQDQLFLAHRVVLACCSDFFRSALLGPAPDEPDATPTPVVLELHHVTVSGFTPLLEYAYTSTLSISTENIIDVLAAASYMQMFSVASTCSDFMKSSILWGPAGLAGATENKPLDAGGAEGGAPTNCTLTPLDGSLSPVSSDCSLVERGLALPVCRESRRKRKSFAMMSPESPSPLLKTCSSASQMAAASSPQVANPSPSFASEAVPQPGMDSSLAFPWTFPFGLDRRFHGEKAKLPESPLRSALDTAVGAADRRLSDFLSCESVKAVVACTSLAPGDEENEDEEEEDVRVKVERLSDEEVVEACQVVSASQSSASLSDQQTVPGSEQVTEELLISPQSSSIGSIDEGVSEGLVSMPGTANPGAHTEDDERLDSLQYPYHLYISPATRPGASGPERPYQCPTCGVRFTRVQNLKQHMLIHSGIKPFQCDRCGKKFTRAYSLKMHRLKHEGKRCYRCQLCHASFTSAAEYKHHMRVSRHAARRPRVYQCKTCGAMFTNSGNLIVHLRSLNHEGCELANYFQSSDFLVPDYLSQVQEEEPLGQYEELGAEPGFPGPSSSVQMPVISQVSSSTHGCEVGLLSPAPPAPLVAGSLEEEEEAGPCDGLRTPACRPSPSPSPDASPQENAACIKLGAITIE